MVKTCLTRGESNRLFAVVAFMISALATFESMGGRLFVRHRESPQNIRYAMQRVPAEPVSRSKTDATP